MRSRIIRVVLLTLSLVSVSLIGCKEHVQDPCAEYEDPENQPCEIDRGCWEESLHGRCQLLGEEAPIWVCVP